MIHRFLKSQIISWTTKDWVTTVFEDLKYLNLESTSLEEIKNIKQVSFEHLIKERIHEKTLERLENLKNSHSKVKDIEYEIIKMQKYLQPNNIRISREETQLIFKLRCRVTNVKTNMRNMYSEVICDACGIQEESQKHIIQECLKLNENNDSIKYEKIYNGSVSEKVEIAIKFEENFKKLQEYRITWREKIFNEEVFYPMFWDQVTWKYSCLLYYLYRVGNTLLLLLLVLSYDVCKEHSEIFQSCQILPNIVRH